ncbi:NAD(P)-binding domain-containing protein [Streptomyces coeruleoprunus]|uniref:NAD(P)-binding domain-containing protein n=1 Tax=Streptomyces coeruleoprunus TaxID=285563 RepID=A0ABV9XM86_9ACTN
MLTGPVRHLPYGVVRPVEQGDLTGGAAAARTGTLVLLAGGDPSGPPGLRPVLDAIARDVRHFGPAGAAPASS